MEEEHQTRIESTAWSVIFQGVREKPPTLAAENAMPENAYRSATTAIPSARSFSIAALPSAKRKAQESCHESRAFVSCPSSTY